MKPKFFKIAFSAFILNLGIVISANAQSGASQQAIMYYDNLKTCTPYTYSYANPFAKNAMSQNMIKGKSGNNCIVTYILPNNMKMECAFSPAAINSMTSEQKYNEARQGIMSGSTNDPASQYMQNECKTFMNGQPIN